MVCHSEYVHWFSVRSQDRLQTGYAILIKTLPWFVKSATDMEHDDYTRMLKNVRPPTAINELFHYVESLFSFGRGPMVLGEMILRSSSLLFQT